MEPGGVDRVAMVDIDAMRWCQRIFLKMIANLKKIEKKVKVRKT